MFFRLHPKQEGGSETSPKPKNEGIAFSKYIGEDAARELAEDGHAIQNDMQEFKKEADELIRETLEDIPMVSAFRGLIFQEASPEPESPQPGTGQKEPGAPDSDSGGDSPEPGGSDGPIPAPTPEPGNPETDTWPPKIPDNPPVPPPVEPRIPPIGGPIPTPRPPQPIPAPRPPQPAPMPQPEPEPFPPSAPQCPAGPGKADIEKILKALEELAKGLESMGKDILDKVDGLETTVKCRGDEIRKDLKNMQEDAVQFSRKIKDVMHDAALKDLEIQERTMQMLDKAEDKAIERALKTQGLFGGRS